MNTAIFHAIVSYLRIIIIPQFKIKKKINYILLNAAIKELKYTHIFVYFKDFFFQSLFSYQIKFTVLPKMLFFCFCFCFFIPLNTLLLNVTEKFYYNKQTAL